MHLAHSDSGLDHLLRTRDRLHGLYGVGRSLSLQDLDLGIFELELTAIIVLLHYARGQDLSPFWPLRLISIEQILIRLTANKSRHNNATSTIRDNGAEYRHIAFFRLKRTDRTNRTKDADLRANHQIADMLAILKIKMAPRVVAQ